MKLADTSALMTSEDYKERFIAEYVQAVIRYNRLVKVLDTINKPESFTPTCSLEILDMQRVAMSAYLEILYRRAEIEEISLPEIEEG